MKSVISNYIRISKGKAILDGKPLADASFYAPEELYKVIGASYPKFYKMDILSRWAWVAAETLLVQNGTELYRDIDKTRVAVVIGTAEGCLDVDKKYLESTASIPSPALFVYTLPNIMLGEICIRHGFKGEQACTVSKSFNEEELYFWVNDLLENCGMEACLCGWVNAAGGEHDICLFWVEKGTVGPQLSPASLRRLYDNI